MSRKRRFSEDQEMEAASSEPKLAAEGKSSSEKPAKPLPEGYVCNACGAVGLHAIYNCPSKISKKSKTSVKEPDSETKPKASRKPAPEDEAEEHGDNEADSGAAAELLEKKKAKKEKKKAAKEAAASSASQRHAAYVAGLPFDTTRESLLSYIKEHMEGPVSLQPRDVVILSFPDNPKKCKGMAYVNFSDHEEYLNCLKLNGLPIGNMTISVQESKLPVRSPKEMVKPKETRCYRCGGKHDPKECTNPRICYRCKSTEHISSQCPQKKSSS